MKKKNPTTAGRSIPWVKGLWNLHVDILCSTHCAPGFPVHPTPCALICSGLYGGMPILHLVEIRERSVPGEVLSVPMIAFLWEDTSERQSKPSSMLSGSRPELATTLVLSRRPSVLKIVQTSTFPLTRGFTSLLTFNPVKVAAARLHNKQPNNYTRRQVTKVWDGHIAEASGFICRLVQKWRVDDFPLTWSTFTKKEIIALYLNSWIQQQLMR